MLQQSQCFVKTLPAIAFALATVFAASSGLAQQNPPPPNKHQMKVGAVLAPNKLDETVCPLPKDAPSDITFTLTPAENHIIKESSPVASAVIWRRTATEDTKHEYQVFSLPQGTKNLYNYDEYVLIDAKLIEKKKGQGGDGKPVEIPSAAGIASVDIDWPGDPAIPEEDEDTVFRAFRIPTPSPCAMGMKEHDFVVRPMHATEEEMALLSIPDGNKRKDFSRTVSWDVAKIDVLLNNNGVKVALQGGSYKIPSEKGSEEFTFTAVLKDDAVNPGDKFKIRVTGALPSRLTKSPALL